LWQAIAATATATASAAAVAAASAAIVVTIVAATDAIPATAALIILLAGNRPIIPSQQLQVVIDGINMADSMLDVLNEVRAAVEGLQEDISFQGNVTVLLRTAGFLPRAAVTATLRLERALLLDGYTERLSAAISKQTASGPSALRDVKFSVIATDSRKRSRVDIQISCTVEQAVVPMVSKALADAITSGNLLSTLRASSAAEYAALGAFQQLLIGPVFLSSGEAGSVDPHSIADQVERLLSGQTEEAGVQALMSEVIVVRDTVKHQNTTIVTYDRMRTFDTTMAIQTETVTSITQEQHRFTSNAYQQFFDTLAFLTTVEDVRTRNMSVDAQSAKPPPTTHIEASTTVRDGIAILLDCYMYSASVPIASSLAILADTDNIAMQIKALGIQAGKDFSHAAVLAVGSPSTGPMSKLSLLQGPSDLLLPAVGLPYEPLAQRVQAVQVSAWVHERSPGCVGALASKGCISDGDHTFMVRARDSHGNIGEASVYHLQVDTRPPNVLWTTRPAAVTSLRKDRTVEFNFQSDEVDDQGIDVASFDCSLEKGFGVSALVELAPCNQPPVRFIVEDGRFSFRVRATDNAGNIGPTAVHQFLVDGSLPSVQVSNGAPDRFTSQRSATISFNATEPGFFFCTVESGLCLDNSSCPSDVDGFTAFIPCTSPFVVERAPELGLVPGNLLRGDPATTYRLRILVVDEAGNRAEAAEELTWTVDTVPPLAAQFIGAGTGNAPMLSADSTRVLAFTSSAKDHQLFRCRLLEEVVVAPAVWEECSSPWRVEVAAGKATFQVQVIDMAGNTSPIANTSWLVDSAPPSLQRRDLSSNYQTAVLSQKGSPFPKKHSSGMLWIQRYLDPTVRPSSSKGEFTIFSDVAGVVMMKLEVTVESPITLITLLPPASLIDNTGGGSMQLFSQGLPLFVGAAVGKLSFSVTDHLPSPVSLQTLRNGVWSLRILTESSAEPTLISEFSASYAAFFEMYPFFSLSSPAIGGAVSKMQCCLDNQCTSR